MIFIPPLVGDTALAQLHRFRPLRRDGFALYSYPFPGHPGAAGRFSLQTAIGATDHHLKSAADMARRHGTGLFGIGCCVATIPLLASVQGASRPPAHLVLLNPVVQFNPAAALMAFWRYSERYAQGPLGRLRSLPTYLESLLPGIAKNRRRFGALRRKRVALPRLLTEVLTDRVLMGVRIVRTAVTCCYGVSDPFRRHLLSEDASDFKAAIRRHCPSVRFVPLEGTHFLAGRGLRHQMRHLICTAFSRP
ncbi:MAG: hypothetical protein QNJ22_14520 [Desulfosarcinaceae bacterium]|nr:hypothetical protein [Desulfosarcinaceae bacterium]